MNGEVKHASVIPREARPFQGQRAGMVTRAVACAIDAAVVVVLVVVGYLGLNGVVLLLRPRAFHPVTLPTGWVLSAALATAVVYLAVAWGTVGRSYGCHVMGLRVVDRHERRPGPVVSLLRAAFCVLVPVGLLWCAIGRSRRSVQDLVLGTHVVYDWSSRRDVGADVSAAAT